MIEEVGSGVTADNGMYGLNHLGKFLNAEVAEVYGMWQKVLNILFLPVVVLFNSKHTKLNLAGVVLALPMANRADLVVTCVDSINKAACLLKKLGILRRPLICMAGNVLDGTESFLFLHRWLWSGADWIITHAPVDQEKLIRLGLGNKGLMIPVGSDSGFFNPQSSKFKVQNSKLAVSVGADRDRDYRTLFLVAEKLPQLKFVVCCGRQNVAGLKIPKNVEVRINVPSKETRAILSKAGMVVLPLRETCRASGQLALLDAMLMGKSVIVSKTRGVVEPYGLKDGKQVLLPPPENVESLLQAIKELQINGNLRRKLGISARKLALGYTTEKYAEKLKKVIFTSS